MLNREVAITKLQFYHRWLDPITTIVTTITSRSDEDLIDFHQLRMYKQTEYIEAIQIFLPNLKHLSKLYHEPSNDESWVFIVIAH
jgi:hypothetical protein